MVLKLAGKFFIFGLLWWSSIQGYCDPQSTNFMEYLKNSQVSEPIFIVQILFISYFILITLAFLEVKIAIWLVILKLISGIYYFNNQLTTLNNLVLISGLLLYYNKISQIKPLVINKKT